MEHDVCMELAYLYGIAKIRDGKWKDAFINAKSFYATIKHHLNDIIPSQLDFKIPRRPMIGNRPRTPDELAFNVEHTIYLGGVNKAIAEDIKAMIQDLEEHSF